MVSAPVGCAPVSHSQPPDCTLAAREAERVHGFEAITDDIVYSHEVGLAKPDPAAYELTTRRLGVEPAEVLFLDDVEANVDAARAFGWHAVLHVDTATSIGKMEGIIAAHAGRRTLG